MESRGFAFLKRLVIVNLSVVVVGVLFILPAHYFLLFPGSYRVFPDPFLLSFMLGIGSLAGGLVYMEGTSTQTRGKGFLWGLLLGALAGYGIYTLIDWTLFSHMRLVVRYEELYVLLMFLLICAAPQVVQLLLSRHKRVMIAVSLAATVVLLGLAFKLLLMLNVLSLYDFSLLVVLSLLPSFIVMTQALVAQYLPR